jgi:hypothetical protein
MTPDTLAPTTAAEDFSDIVSFSPTHPAPAASATAAAQPAATDTTPPPATTQAAPAAEGTTETATAPEASATPEDPEGPLPGESPQQTAARTRSRLQERINKLTAARYTEAGRANRLAEENEELRRRLDTPARSTDTATPAATNAGDEPAVYQPAKFAKTIDDFENLESFLEARDAHVDAERQKVEESKAALTRQQQIREAHARAELDATTKAAANVDAFRADHADYDEVVRSIQIRVHNDVMRELKGSDHSAAIAYHLGKDPRTPGDSRPCRFRSKSRRSDASKAALSRAPRPPRPPRRHHPPTPKPRPASSAPPPIAPEGGSAASSRRLEEMDVDDQIDELNRRERGGRASRR